MKRILYIGLFVVLGVVLQFVVHALVEMGAIYLLVTDFERYHLGLSWHTWEWVHHIGSIILLVGGALLGYYQGRYW